MGVPLPPNTHRTGLYGTCFNVPQCGIIATQPLKVGVAPMVFIELEKHLHFHKFESSGDGLKQRCPVFFKSQVGPW